MPGHVPRRGARRRVGRGDDAPTRSRPAGEWWGLFCDGAPVLCAALADADRSVLQIRAMCERAAHAGPAAGRALALSAAAPPRRAGPSAGPPAFWTPWPRAANAPLVAALPVKTGGALLAAYFAAGFYLWAMRPLASLRPHYIFLRGGVQTGRQCRIIRETDTLALSRALEEGAAGTGVWYAQGQRCVCLAPKG